jgi:hypothetical protein
VLAGVVEVDYFGGGGVELAGQVPDPGCAIAEDDELADVLGAAADALGVQKDAEPVGGLEGGRGAPSAHPRARPAAHDLRAGNLTSMSRPPSPPGLMTRVA